MKFLVMLITAFCLYSSPVYAQLESMTLKGEGDIRYLGFIKVYDAFFYVDPAKKEIDTLTAQRSKCLKIVYNVSLDPEDLIEGANTILTRQHSEDIINRLQGEIDQLHAAYKPVEDGDYYTLCYDADSHITTLSLNSDILTEIQSKEFSDLYFGIWLGNNEPIDEDLRDELLAR